MDMFYKILIVDDEPANLRLLERLFSRVYHCLTASSGAEAIQLLERHDVAILISDQRMPMMTGIELLKHTAAVRPHMVRILLTGYTDVDALVEAINTGLVYMYITKPWNNEDLKLRVNRACEHYEQNKNRHALADANQRLLLRLREVKLRVASALSEMLRVRDKRSFAHASRVRNYAMAIAAKMDVSDELKEELSLAALLHDLGRIDVFRDCLSNTQVASRQHAIVRAHSECEAQLLHAIPELANVAEIVSGHQENFDGSGIPSGLSAEQIPLLSRILRLADEYDQMLRFNPAAHMPHNEAMVFLTQRSGKQFDPKVVEVLSQLSADELEILQPPINGAEDSFPRPETFEPVYLDTSI